MNQYAFNALRYFSEQCTLNNENVSFVEDFNGKVYLWELNPPEKCLKCKTYLNQ